jgi:protein YibB
MNDVTIVTAFFDIGRGDWTPDKGLPHYLHRTTDTYVERFGHLATLENEMVIYTSEDLVDKIKALRGDRPTHICTVDYHNSFVEVRERISAVQKSESYQSRINPQQRRNPEYWSADYVLVNALKATFISKAIDTNYCSNDLIAWVDFGYCRDVGTLYGVKHWYSDLDKDKIHLFKLKDYVEGTYIDQIIFNNDVHMVGGAIIAGKQGWKNLEYLVHHSLTQLLDNNLVDDDQTLLLMSYLSAKDSFELHPMTEALVLFRDYNKTE